MPLRHRLGYGLACLLAALILIAPIGYRRLVPPARHYASDVDHFLYGSVGVEASQGIPLLVWRAMPGVCMPPGEAAAGYRQFGFQWAPGHVTPIGMPVETVIVPRVGLNCALCHVGRVGGADGKARLLVGAPNGSLDLQAYLRFLFACAASPAFTPDAVLTEAARLGYRLNPLQRLLYRQVIIPQVKRALARQRWQLSFMEGQTGWGPGRSPGFQPAKVQVLGRPFDGTLDIVDFPALWAMRNRAGGFYHWDGANGLLHEVFLNSGIGNGASARSIDVASLDRMERWIKALPPPRFPWPIDRGMAAQGQAVFAHECADCHASGGGKTGQVIPIGWLGTDRNRLDAMTPETIEGFRALTGYRWGYTHFAKTNGYVAAPLDGIWARAPYLHNGSVPTLDALLRAPAARPQHFRRGGAAYDPLRMGFRDDHGALFDTGLPGNANGGHLWGTDLPEPERRALIEYLKNL